MVSLLDKIRRAKPSEPSPASTASLAGLSEAERISAIPRVDYAGADLTAELRLPDGELELFPLQSEALVAARHANGFFGPIAVGEGKTFPALLFATVLDCDFALVFTKAKVVDQTREVFELLKRHFKVKPTRIASYDALSRQSGERLLDETVARWTAERVVVVCDEAHCLANPKSTRTGRILRFARENPKVRFAMLSGTLLRKSVKDCAHLSELALKELSPFPSAGVYGTRKIAHLEAWSEVLDVRGRPAPEDWSLVSPLLRFAEASTAGLRGEAKKAVVRRAFATRLRSAPGVVCSRGEKIGSSLLLVPVDLDVPARILDALNTLKRRDEDPDGELFVDDLGKARKARELAAGFFYRWIWKDGEPDLDWLEARADWNRAVRNELDRSAERDYDSPFLVATRIQRELDELPRRKWRHIHDSHGRGRKRSPSPIRFRSGSTTISRRTPSSSREV
jgi:hypothetical protein